MSYLDSGTSETDPDPGMKEPSLARIAAQHMISSRPGKALKPSSPQVI